MPEIEARAAFLVDVDASAVGHYLSKLSAIISALIAAICLADVALLADGHEGIYALLALSGVLVTASTLTLLPSHTPAFCQIGIDSDGVVIGRFSRRRFVFRPYERRSRDDATVALELVALGLGVIVLRSPSRLGSLWSDSVDATTFRRVVAAARWSRMRNPTSHFGGALAR